MEARAARAEAPGRPRGSPGRPRGSPGRPRWRKPRRARTEDARTARAEGDRLDARAARAETRRLVDERAGGIPWCLRSPRRASFLPQAVAQKRPPPPHPAARLTAHANHGAFIRCARGKIRPTVPLSSRWDESPPHGVENSSRSARSRGWEEFSTPTPTHVPAPQKAPLRAPKPLITPTSGETRSTPGRPRPRPAPPRSAIAGCTWPLDPSARARRS